MTQQNSARKLPLHRRFDPATTSLGWHSELIFARFAGTVTQRDDCLAVRTPSDPTFYWGNFLLLQRAPSDDDLDAWMARFDAEVAAGQPAVEHVAFGLDVPHATLPAPFADAGFSLECSSVLVLSEARMTNLCSAPSSQYAIRPLRMPQEVPDAVELQVQTQDTGFEPHGYRVHRQRKMACYSAMDAAGLGHWFGAWRGETLVADCGLFAGDTPHGHIGRFQHVETHPAHRRRGLCRAMVHHACRYGFEQMGLKTLVMCADPGDVAIGIYRSIGFEHCGTLWHLQRRAPQDRRLP